MLARWVSSKSSPWINMPLTSAASRTGRRVGRAMSVHPPTPPRRVGAGRGGGREAVGVRGNAAAKRIENQELGPLQDGSRDVLEGEPAGELAQGAGRRGCCGQVIQHVLSSVRGWGGSYSTATLGPFTKSSPRCPPDTHAP